MVSTQSDGVGNLVDALCGRLPASVPVQLPGAQPQRRPGIVLPVNSSMMMISPPLTM